MPEYTVLPHLLPNILDFQGGFLIVTISNNEHLDNGSARVSILQFFVHTSGQPIHYRYFYASWDNVIRESVHVQLEAKEEYADERFLWHIIGIVVNEPAYRAYIRDTVAI